MIKLLLVYTFYMGGYNFTLEETIKYPSSESCIAAQIEAQRSVVKAHENKDTYGYINNIVLAKSSCTPVEKDEPIYACDIIAGKCVKVTSIGEIK